MVLLLFCILRIVAATPKKVFLLLHAQFILYDIVLFLVLNILVYCRFINPNYANIIFFGPKCLFPNLYLRFACLSKIISADSPLNIL